MINKYIKILFFLVSLNIFSQENVQKIIFNIHGEIFIPPKNEYKNIGTKKAVTLRADIKIKEGNFSVLLIDFNANNNFNDYRDCCKAKGSDGIIISDYKENKVVVPYNQRRFITKDYIIAFNGKTFVLKDLHATIDGQYEANLIRKNVDLDKVFNKRNRVVIDNLPDIMLNNYYNKNEIRLKDKLQKDKKLVILVMNQLSFIHYLKYDHNKVKNSIRKYFPKTIFETVVIIKNRVMYDFMINKFNYKKRDFLIIDVSEKEKIMKLGYNMNQTSIMLFDEKGKIIFTDYDNFLRIKDLEKKKKKKN